MSQFLCVSSCVVNICRRFVNGPVIRQCSLYCYKIKCGALNQGVPRRRWNLSPSDHLIPITLKEYSEIIDHRRRIKLSSPTLVWMHSQPGVLYIHRAWLSQSCTLCRSLISLFIATDGCKLSCHLLESLKASRSESPSDFFNCHCIDGPILSLISGPVGLMHMNLTDRELF